MTDTIAAKCRRDFYPAFHSSGSRPLSGIKWFVLHDEEAPTAEGAARYFQSPNSGGSAHLCVDDKECYRTLANSTVPWGARSAPQISANTRGIHLEMAGYARWSAVIWRKHLRTLKRAAYLTALHCKKFDIPVQFVKAAELPGKAGITTHKEITYASKRLDPANASDYDHIDPGPFFPRLLFMALVRRYLKEMSLSHE